VKFVDEMAIKSKDTSFFSILFFSLWIRTTVGLSL